MPFTDDAKNAAIDALDALMTHMSLHSAYSATGANELSGGSYARQATAHDASASGEAVLTATEAFSVPAATVAFIGYWSASSGGTFYGMFPVHSSANPPKIFLGESSDDTIKSDAHGFSDTNPVVVFGDALPSGLTAGTIYYVRDAATDTFKLAATAGGSAIDLTTDGRGIVQRITPEVFASAGTYNVTAAPINLNLLT